MKKVQLPVIGGIRKVITPGSNVAVGTTIAELGSNTVTLATLAALISQLQAQQQNTGGGNIGTGNKGTLVPGPGLAGGGVLIGNVPIRLVAPIPWGLEGGGGEDGDPGPPGMAGVRGTNGATGGVGPTGPAIFMAADDGQDGDAGPAGAAGAIGATGLTGPTGPAGTTLVYANATIPGGNTIANTSTETFFTSSYTIPAGSLTVGMVLRVKLFGVYSTGIVAPSIALRMYFGATVMIASGTLTTVANITNDGWSAEGLFIVQTIGTTGTIEAQGLSEFSTASTAVLFVNMDNAAPVTVNTTVSETIQISVQWGGTVNASDTITLREMTVEVLTIAGVPSAPILIGPSLMLFGEDGEEGGIGPPGAAGAPGAGSSSNPFNISPDTHLPGVPTFVANDPFETAVLDTTGTRFIGATPWIKVNWSALGGTTSAPLAFGWMSLFSEANASGTRDPQLVVQAVAGGAAWSYYMKINVNFQGGSGNIGSIVLYEQSTNKSLEFGMFNGNNSSFFSRVIPATIVQVGSTGLNPMVQDAFTGQYQSKYFRITLASGNVAFEISLDGLKYGSLPGSPFAVATYFTTAPSHIGFLVESVGSSVQTILNADELYQIA